MNITAVYPYLNQYAKSQKTKMEQLSFSPKFLGHLKPKISPSGFFAVGEDFKNNLSFVLEAASDYWISQMKARKEKLPLLVVSDDSPMSKKYMDTVVRHFQTKGIDVYSYGGSSWRYLPLPLGIVAYLTKHFDTMNLEHPKVAGALMLTAGSRRWETGGLRFLNTNGQLFSLNEISRLQKYVGSPKRETLNNGKGKGEFYKFDYKDETYKKYLGQLIDFRHFLKANVIVFFDALHGAMKDINTTHVYPWIKHLRLLHDSLDQKNKIDTIRLGPSLNIENKKKILEDFKVHHKELKNKLGFIFNGDGGCLNLIDNSGNHIPVEDIACLLIKHLVENKKRSGVIVRSWDTSSKIDEVARKYSIPVIEVPQGFANISEQIRLSKDPVLISVDSSGAITTIGGLNIKDGYLTALRLIELLGMEGKALNTLIENQNNLISRKFDYQSFRIFSTQRDKIYAHLENLSRSSSRVGKKEIDPKQTMTMKDLLSWNNLGTKELKIYFRDGSWVSVSKSKEEAHCLNIKLETVTSKGLEKLNEANVFKKQLLDVLKKRFYLSDDSYK